jgi:hypothetical protein
VALHLPHHHPSRGVGVGRGRKIKESEVGQKEVSKQGSSARGSNLVLTFQLRMEPRNNNTEEPHCVAADVAGGATA